MTPDFEHVYGNLRTAMRFFGEATEHGDVRQLEHGVAISAGLEYGVFNICMLNPDAAEPVRGLQEFARFFQSRARRWSMWICEDALPTPEKVELRKALAKQGLREITVAPGMMTTVLGEPRHELPAIECVPVTSQALREAFGGLAAVCFDVPFGVAREVYYPERAWKGAYRGYVGFVGGRPIAIAALVATGDTLGVYSLAVQPESRRLGYGEALLRASIAQASVNRSFERIVLQSSESGQSLYRRLGFRDVTRFSVFLTK